MIFDCFTYFREEELVKIRINEFRGLDITHVIVEGDHTFSGLPKPLNFTPLQIQYPDDKIIYIPFNFPVVHQDAWANEMCQRNHIGTVLQMLQPKDDDVIIISDVDEIPFRRTLEHYRPEMGFCALRMDYHSYYLNRLQSSQNWNQARIMPYAYLKDKTPEGIRRSGFPNVMERAGVHYSYLGGVDRIMEKVRSFSHQEYNTPEGNNATVWNKAMTNGVSVEVQHQYVREYPEEFEHLIYVGD